MKVYLAGGLMYFDEIRDLHECPMFKEILFSYFFVTDGKPSHKNHWKMARIRAGEPHRSWFYHPESESYFVAPNDDERVNIECLEIGPAITETKEELKQTKRRVKKETKKWRLTKKN